MQVTRSDVEKGMKSPSIWEQYKKILDNAEEKQVDTSIPCIKD